MCPGRLKCRPSSIDRVSANSVHTLVLGTEFACSVHNTFIRNQSLVVGSYGNRVLHMRLRGTLTGLRSDIEVGADVAMKR